MINLELLNEVESIDLKLKENTGGGTSDYNDLSNKPTINGTELKGNLTTEDLGIDSASLDVQINGTSIVENGVANIPKASTKNFGVVMPMANSGIVFNGDYLNIAQATSTNITSRNSTSKPITPQNLDYAVKCAMTDGKGAEWSATEKANARARMGLEWRLIDTMEVSDVAKVEITFPKEYSEFMVIADISGSGASMLMCYPAYIRENGDVTVGQWSGGSYSPSDKKEHYELTFEKMIIENVTHFKLSGFQCVDYASNMKQNVQSTGWFSRLDISGTYQCDHWNFVRFSRTITNATFKIFAR